MVLQPLEWLARTGFSGRSAAGYAFGDAVAVLVDPHVAVARVAVHVPIAPGDSAIAHQDGDLMGRLGRQGPEVPLHVVIAQASVHTPLLRVDEALEPHGVACEKNTAVVSHHPEIVSVFD